MATDGQGVGVIRTQHALAVGQQFGERAGRIGRIPRQPMQHGEVFTGGQGVGVIRTQYPLPVGQYLLERRGRTGRIPRHPMPLASDSGAVLRRMFFISAP